MSFCISNDEFSTSKHILKVMKSKIVHISQIYNAFEVNNLRNL